MSLLNQFKQIIDEVNSEVIEKEEIVHYIALALLTRKNVFILGGTGQAKSYVIDTFRKRIVGAKQFKTLMTKQKDEEQLFARVNLNSLIKPRVKDTAEMTKIKEEIERLKNIPDQINRLKELQERYEILYKIEEMNAELVPEMNTSNKIPDAHFVYLDETFKANDGVLNSLLTAMNEREYSNEGVTVKIPVHCFFGSSNEIPDFNNPEEAILRPFYDRYEIKLISDYIKEKSNLMTAMKVVRQKGTNSNMTTITLDELEQLQEEVKKVVIPDKIDELLYEIKMKLAEKDIIISDRKLLNYYPLVQAEAYLDGRNTAAESDLLVLKNYLWDRPEDIETIVNILVQFTANPLKHKIDEALLMATESFEQVENANINDATTKAKQLKKFRSEIVKVYDLLKELESKASAEKDKTAVKDAISKIESYSKKAHEKLGYTYAPLEELKLLNL